MKVAQKVSKAKMIERIQRPFAKLEESMKLPKIRSVARQRMFRDRSIAERFDKRLNFLLH